MQTNADGIVHVDNQYPIQIHYITVATIPHPILDTIKQQIAMNHETIHVLGCNENRKIGWDAHGNFGLKLREVHDFLFRTNIRPRDIIVFTDAYDVAYTGKLTQVVDRFRRFSTPIVFGCEKYCNPDPEERSKYPYTDSEFPFLNSGLFVGEAWALRHSMSGYVYLDKHDDQRFWTQAFFQHPDLISLDYNNELFLNTVDIDMKYFSWDGEHATYKDKKPLFIHVNGPNKQLIFTMANSRR